MLKKVPPLVGPPVNVNITDCQSPEVSVRPPKSTDGERNRGVKLMPTLFNCRWMISNVRARSGLPDVVVNANVNSPTPGQLKIFELPELGLSGPPVHPFFFKSAIVFVWLKPSARTALRTPPRTA